MEEYSAEFENLMIKGDLREAEEQSIAGYLVGMRFDIAIIIYMQPYNTLQDMIKLALKIEVLNKYRSSTTTRSVAKEGFAEDSTSRNPNDAKTTPKLQVISKVNKLQQDSTSKSKSCYKCQAFEHIAYECLNWKVVALVEEDEAKEEDVEEGVASYHVQEDEEELTMPDHGTSLVAQRSLKVGAVVSEEDWLRSNVFHTRCTSKGKVCSVIIDGGSFENYASMEMVKTLGLNMVPHPKPFNLC